MQLPEKTVYKKLIQTGKMAEKLGADILGLGAFTSVVGDAGITISKNLNIPVTTGDSYTVAVAVQALELAAKEMEIEIEQSTAAVVGATGAIGQVCSALLANKAKTVYLIGKNQKRMDELKIELQNKNATAELIATTDLAQIKHAQLILTVTSDTEEIIQPEHLQSGSVICDVARPRDVSAKVAQQRDDILVIDGGVVDVPGSVNFNFDFGFPEGKAYACMAETFALALENRLESYTIGKKITRAQVQEIDKIATRHGFRLSGFRSFEKTITNEQIDKIKLRANAARQNN